VVLCLKNEVREAKEEKGMNLTELYCGLSLFLLITIILRSQALLSHFTDEETEVQRAPQWLIKPAFHP
jgi:hypothetical protein